MSALGVIIISALTTLVTIGLLLIVTHRFFAHQHSGYFNHKSRHQCSTRTRNGLKSLDFTLDFVESALKLNASQLILWDEIKTALAQSQSELFSYREVLTSEVNFEHRINRVEDFVNDSLIILQRLKPQLISFYRSLNNHQQETLDNLINKKQCKFAR